MPSMVYFAILSNWSSDFQFTSIAGCDRNTNPQKAIRIDKFNDGVKQLRSRRFVYFRPLLLATLHHCESNTTGDRVFQSIYNQQTLYFRPRLTRKSLGSKAVNILSYPFNQFIFFAAFQLTIAISRRRVLMPSFTSKIESVYFCIVICLGKWRVAHRQTF